MQTYLIAVESVTYAMKAQSILRSKGYYCEVQRTPKNLSTGCGYSIRVKGNYTEIETELNRSGIKIKDSMEAGGVIG